MANEIGDKFAQLSLLTTFTGLLLLVVVGTLGHGTMFH
jgi:hypothetical protein